MYCEGAIDKTVAKFIGCAITTFHRLKNEFPEIVEIQKESKRHVDDDVEAALLKRAKGFEVEETHTEVKLNPNGTGQTTVVRKVKKYIVPDAIAAIFWLKNRRPAEWRDKHVMEHEGRIITGFEFEQVDDRGEG